MVYPDQTDVTFVVDWMLNIKYHYDRIHVLVGLNVITPSDFVNCGSLFFPHYTKE